MGEELIVFLIIVGMVGFSLGVPAIFIHFSEIVEFFQYRAENFKESLKYPFVQYKKNKQMSCYHRWRKLDGDYSRTETIFRYRCPDCKSEKKLRESESVRFEKDFMSDW